MIAIIRFKSIPGKRFEVVEVEANTCGACWFNYRTNHCPLERTTICNPNKQFRKIKEEKK